MAGRFVHEGDHTVSRQKNAVCLYQRAAQGGLRGAEFLRQRFLRDSAFWPCAQGALQAVHAVLALFLPVEKQDILQALPVGDKAVPVYRRPGIMPVLLDSVCISPAVSDTPVQQALSSQRTLLPQAVL